jgi:hypothetical protein
MGGAQTSALLAGATIHAGFAYVVDRGILDEAGRPVGGLRVYDVSNPLHPTLLTIIPTPGGYPRNLQVIPSYSYRPPVRRGPAVLGGRETREGDECFARDRVLLALTGGITGGNYTSAGGGSDAKRVPADLWTSRSPRPARRSRSPPRSAVL